MESFSFKVKKQIQKQIQVINKCAEVQILRKL